MSLLRSKRDAASQEPRPPEELVKSPYKKSQFAPRDQREPSPVDSVASVKRVKGRPSTEFKFYNVQIPVYIRRDRYNSEKVR